MEREVYKRKVKKWEIKHHVTTALLVGFALIFFWRGVWMLADFYLFPDNPNISAIASIIIGMFILYIRDLDLKELYQ